MVLKFLILDKLYNKVNNFYNNCNNKGALHQVNMIAHFQHRDLPPNLKLHTHGKLKSTVLVRCCGGLP